MESVSTLPEDIYTNNGIDPSSNKTGLYFPSLRHRYTLSGAQPLSARQSGVQPASIFFHIIFHGARLGTVFQVSRVTWSRGVK